MEATNQFNENYEKPFVKGRKTQNKIKQYYLSWVLDNIILSDQINIMKTDGQFGNKLWTSIRKQIGVFIKPTIFSAWYVYARNGKKRIKR